MKFTFIAALFVFAFGLNAQAGTLYVDSNGGGTATGCNWTLSSTSQISSTSTQTVEALRCDQTGSAVVLYKAKMNGVCYGMSSPLSGYTFSGNCAAWSLSKNDVCTMHNVKVNSGVPASGLGMVMGPINQYCSACGGARAVVSYTNPTTHEPYYDIYCN